MLIAVFSDSHGNTENMRRAIAGARPDRILHLGDLVRDAEAIAAEYPRIPICAVQGNCDLGCVTAPEDRLFELEGVRIFMAHGHRHHVKLGLNSFCNAVHFSGSALGLFGHTHKALWKQYGAMEILNPGSIGDPIRPTYGLVELKNGAAFCRIAELT